MISVLIPLSTTLMNLSKSDKLKWQLYRAIKLRHHCEIKHPKSVYMSLDTTFANLFVTWSIRCCLNIKLHRLMMLRSACLNGLASTLNQLSKTATGLISSTSQYIFSYWSTCRETTNLERRAIHDLSRSHLRLIFKLVDSCCYQEHKKHGKKSKHISLS